jgi:uncharacterized protein YjiS (DUF1127 family)
MTLIHQASLRPAAPRRSWLRRLPGLAGSLVALWYDRYLQRLALAELDDRLLADIGVSPEEARRECAQPFWRPKANTRLG